MKFGRYLISLVALAAVMCPLSTTTVAEDEDGLYIPLFTYRTGPFAPGGSKVANGVAAYF